MIPSKFTDGESYARRKGVGEFVLRGSQRHGEGGIYTLHERLAGAGGRAARDSILQLVAPAPHPRLRGEREAPGHRARTIAIMGAKQQMTVLECVLASLTLSPCCLCLYWDRQKAMRKPMLVYASHEYYKSCNPLPRGITEARQARFGIHLENQNQQSRWGAESCYPPPL